MPAAVLGALAVAPGKTSGRIHAIHRTCRCTCRCPPVPAFCLAGSAPWLVQKAGRPAGPQATDRRGRRSGLADLTLTLTPILTSTAPHEKAQSLAETRLQRLRPSSLSIPTGTGSGSQWQWESARVCPALPALVCLDARPCSISRRANHARQPTAVPRRVHGPWAPSPRSASSVPPNNTSGDVEAAWLCC